MGSAVGELTGANRRAARAAGAAAFASQQAAERFEKRQEELIKATRERIDDPRALQAQEQALSTQERQLARQEELAEAINPALKQAALQAAGLLRGEEAAALAPVRRQRDRQRRQLLDTLRSQLGPGAETSSAGQQALNRFDAETDTLLGRAQQETLSGLLGTTLQARPDITRSATGLSNLGLAPGQQELAFMQGATQARSPAAQQVVQTAGGQFAGDLIRAQQQQAFGGELFGTGLLAATGAFGDFSGLFGGGSAGGSPVGGGGTGGGTLIRRQAGPT